MTAKDTANIGTPERVPLTDLNLYHKNPRVGDTQAIKGSIVANGIFRPVVVNKGTYTDKPNEILAGNHTVKAIRELAEEHPDDARWQHVDVWMVDVDSERAARIVLADNRTADLGAYDDKQLFELLNEVDHDLDGTGYDEDDLSDLRDLMELSEDYLTGDPQEDVEEKKIGEDFKLADVLYGDPNHEVHDGQIYKLASRNGHSHLLVILDVAHDHTVWSKFLTGRILAPYPDLYLTLSDLSYSEDLLLIQPNHYLAGHLLDKHASVHGEDSIELISGEK